MPAPDARPHPAARFLRRAALTAALALAATGCSAPGSTTAQVEELYGGAASAALVLRPDGGATIEAYRIDGMARMEGRAAGPLGALHGYPVLAGPVAVDARTAQELADALGRDDTYLWDVAKGCAFVPGLAVRYRTESATVDVLFCFSCDELEAYVGDAKAGHEDFDPRRAELVAVAKHLFPDDAQIQALD